MSEVEVRQTCFFCRCASILVEQRAPQRGQESGRREASLDSTCLPAFCAPLVCMRPRASARLVLSDRVSMLRSRTGEFGVLTGCRRAADRPRREVSPRCVCTSPVGVSRVVPRFASVCCFAPRVTWLILPVVICLSQRLSHACLSTGPSKAKPRMAH